MDIERPETPMPPVDSGEPLDVLEEGDQDDFDDLEIGDALDFPERPATPEPKDDSSNGEDEEEEEIDDNEDIALVIAKAKAAILKRQREAENSAIDAVSLDTIVDADVEVKGHDSQTMETNVMVE